MTGRDEGRKGERRGKFAGGKVHCSKIATLCFAKNTQENIRGLGDPERKKGKKKKER